MSLHDFFVIEKIMAHLDVKGRCAMSGVCHWWRHVDLISNKLWTAVVTESNGEPICIDTQEKAQSFKLWMSKRGHLIKNLKLHYAESRSYNEVAAGTLEAATDALVNFKLVLYKNTKKEDEPEFATLDWLPEINSLKYFQLDCACDLSVDWKLGWSMPALETLVLNGSGIKMNVYTVADMPATLNRLVVNSDIDGFGETLTCLGHLPGLHLKELIIDTSKAGQEFGWDNLRLSLALRQSQRRMVGEMLVRPGSLPALTALNLKGEHLHSLTPGLVQRAKTLKWLDLSECPFKYPVGYDAPLLEILRLMLRKDTLEFITNRHNNFPKLKLLTFVETEHSMEDQSEAESFMRELIPRLVWARRIIDGQMPVLQQVNLVLLDQGISKLDPTNFTSFTNIHSKMTTTNNRRVMQIALPTKRYWDDVAARALAAWRWDLNALLAARPALEKLLTAKELELMVKGREIKDEYLNEVQILASRGG